MRAHILQHVAFEGLGSIGPWLETCGAEITYTRFFESPRLPALDDIDLVVAMGGPMSVNEEEKFPWLIPEKQFIRKAAQRDVAVLGVCLGAQLIAEALGARVYPNPVREIGWLPVRAVPVPSGTFVFPAEFTSFHWHGETFDLPPGAVRIAESDGCANQAFQLKHNVIGLQFHLETQTENVSALLENCAGDLTSGPYVQSEAEMRAAPAECCRKANTIMDEVLSYLTRPGL